MSHTIWTPLRYDVKDDNAVPPRPGTDPLWCDGTAFRYPTESGVIGSGSEQGKQKAKPLRLSRYNQINQIRNAIVSESVRDEWLANKPLTKDEIQEFKEDINEWQHEFEADWEIPIGDEEFFHKHDINELRRLATYPNTVYEQDVRTPFPYLHDLCIDKMTKGMRCYVETTEENGGNSGGWSSYVNTQIAPVNQSHRFWVWTRYPEYGDWYDATVGIIGLDGKMKPPIAGYGWGGWTPTPNSGDDGSYWLIQLVQDVHKPVEELATVLKALKGRQHWMAYTWWSSFSCTIECRGDNCAGCGPDLWIYRWSSYYDDCLGRVETEFSEGHPSLYECVPGYCEDSPYYSSGSYPAEWEDIETGEDFFHTWEYYMDQL
jgi:hypothetical protein